MKRSLGKLRNTPEDLQRQEPPIQPKKKIYQVYCNTEPYINEWLMGRPDLDVVDIKFASNEVGEIIMVIYREEEL